MKGIYALGVAGEPVRTVVQGSKPHAFMQVRPGEIVCLLPAIPNEPVMITADGLDVVPIPPTLDELKQRARTKAKAERNRAQAAGVDNFDTDLPAITKLNAVAIAALADPSFAVEWTMRDNSVRSLDAIQIVAAAAKIGRHLADCHAATSTILAQIDRATTRGELECLP